VSSLRDRFNLARFFLLSIEGAAGRVLSLQRITIGPRAFGRLYKHRSTVKNRLWYKYSPDSAKYVNSN